MQIGSHSSKSSISKIIVLFVTTLAVAFSYSAKTSEAASNRMVFVTVDCDDLPISAIENLAALPNIDGLGIEVHWSKIQVKPGKYDWSALDAAIRTAAIHKKYVTLYLLGSPRNPTWLTEGGKAQTFSSSNFTRGVQIEPIPWDKVYLSSYTQFLQAAALHFKSLNMTPYIFAIGMVAPQRDCTIVGSINGKLGTAIYNRASYMLACKQMIDTYARTFPNARQFVPAPSGATICTPIHDPEFFQELMLYAIGRHKQGCWLFARDLSSAGSGNTSIYNAFSRSTGLAYQLPASTPEEASPFNFARAINAGLANGAMYFEIPPAIAINNDGLISQTIYHIHHD